jgi:hypothetical protein
MFKKLKDMLFGSKEVKQTEEVVKATPVSEPKPRKKSVKVKETTNPVVVKAPASKASTKKGKHTKASLTELTKKDLIVLAKTEFKLDLNARAKKDNLIKDILNAQGK